MYIHKLMMRSVLWGGGIVTAREGWSASVEGSTAFLGTVYMLSEAFGLDTSAAFYIWYAMVIACLRLLTTPPLASTWMRCLLSEALCQNDGA